jgi:hypothetical protein
VVPALARLLIEMRRKHKEGEHDGAE